MADITSIATTLGREAATKVRDFAAHNDQAKKAKDAAYTVIGLGVMGVQKLNVLAKSLQTKVDETIDTEGLSAAVTRTKADVTATLNRNKVDVTATIKRTASDVDAKLSDVIAKAEAVVAPLEAKLPEPAREVAAKVRALTHVARAKVTEAITDEVAADEAVVDAVVVETPASGETTDAPSA